MYFRTKLRKLESKNRHSEYFQISHGICRNLSESVQFFWAFSDTSFPLIDSIEFCCGFDQIVSYHVDSFIQHCPKSTHTHTSHTQISCVWILFTDSLALSDYFPILSWTTCICFRSDSPKIYSLHLIPWVCTPHFSPLWFSLCLVDFPS